MTIRVKSVEVNSTLPHFDRPLPVRAVTHPQFLELVGGRRRGHEVEGGVAVKSSKVCTDDRAQPPEVIVAGVSSDVRVVRAHEWDLQMAGSSDTGYSDRYRVGYVNDIWCEFGQVMVDQLGGKPPLLTAVDKWHADSGNGLHYFVGRWAPWVIK